MPHLPNRTTQAIPICGADNPDCGGGGGGGTGGATPIDDTLTDASSNIEHITWNGNFTAPVNGTTTTPGGTLTSSASAAVPSAFATTMTETVTVPSVATYSVPLQVDDASPPATQTYPNGMTVSENATNGTASATQTDANGVTWTANVSIDTANTMATVDVTSTAGDSFTKLVPVNDDMVRSTLSGARSVQSVRSIRAWSEAQQSQVARGVAMVAMGVLVIAGAPLAAAVIGIAVGIAMIAAATRSKR